MHIFENPGRRIKYKVFSVTAENLSNLDKSGMFGMHVHLTNAAVTEYIQIWVTAAVTEYTSVNARSSNISRLQ